MVNTTVVMTSQLNMTIQIQAAIVDVFKSTAGVDTVTWATEFELGDNDESTDLNEMGLPIPAGKVSLVL